VDAWNDRYNILDTVSMSGRVKLVKAWDRDHERLVALKVVSSDQTMTRDQIVGEARVLLSLTPHRGLATARYDFFAGNRYVIVMDWIDGTDLDSVLAERGDPGLPVPEALNYVRQVAAALDHLHSHDPPVIHGDVKPANVMLRPDSSVVLVDFGVARLAGDVTHAGTHGFVAPEVGAGGAISPAADVYSLAATTVALITGRAPDPGRPLFEGVDPGEVGPLTRALRRALSSDPGNRQASAGELAHELQPGSRTPWTGVLSFLVAVINDFADLSEHHAAAMPEFLDRLDDTLATVVDAHRGRTLPSMSHDSIRWSVFQEAADAVSAALRLHAEVERDRWPEGIRITMGVAIDSGPAPLRNGGDYYGPTVARAWRTAPRVPPRATVISQTSADLARGRMPSGSILVEIPNSQPGEDGKLFGLASETNQRVGLLESPAAGQEPRSVWMLSCQLDAPDALTGEEHRRVTDRYRSVLAQASTRFGGRVLSVDQDIAILLFAKPNEAVRAALWAREIFGDAPDPVGDIQARMAIHVESGLRGSELESPVTTHSSLVVCRAANPGQILVSESAAELLASELPPGVTLVNLGTHRLSDLGHAQPVYQLADASTAEGFPRPQSLDGRPHNLPAHLDRFVGRRSELRALSARLADHHRICVLTGPPGVGKSRLALQAAAQVLRVFTDGVFLVDASNIGPSEDLSSSLLAAMGVRDSGSGTFAGRRSDPMRPAVARLVDHLQDQQMLLVLDNLDTCISMATALAESVSRRCPGVGILATSREALGVEGEAVTRVRPLEVPAPGEPADDARRRSAVRLFIDRALPKRPDLALDEEAIGTIGAICRAVDGLPLGIEFAAASLRYQSLEGLATTLASGDDARASSVFGPSSQSNVLEWTFETLSESEASVLCRLSTFMGGFSLDAAEVVCAGAEGNTVSVPLCVASLVDKSLIEYESGSSGDWYRLLEVTRRFAEKRLLQSGVAEAANAAHLRWYDQLSRQAESNLRAGGQLRWLAAIDREYDNLRIAIERAARLDPPVGVEISSRLCLFWLMRGRIGEGMGIIDRALEAAGASDLVAGRGHLAVGILSAFAGDGERALVSGRQAWAAGASLADRQLQGTATWLLGLAEMMLGRAAAGTERFADAAVTASQTGDDWLFAHAQTSLGNAYFLAGDMSSARSSYGEALAIREQHQDLFGIAWTAFRLGVLQSAQGEYAASRELLNQALAAASAIEYTQGILLAKLGIADTCYLQGDLASAAAAYLEARRLARIVEDEASESFALGGLTQLAVEGQHEDETSGWLAAEAETGSRMSLQARASLLRSRSVVAELHRYEAEATARRRGALLLYHHIGDIRAAIEQLEELTRHAGQFDDLPTAAALLAVAETLRGRTGLRVPPRTTERLAPIRRQIDESHDPKVRDAAMTGQAMSLSAAVALALRVGRG
jgi:predicted ATPase/serine/threonine protein kinase